MATGYDITGQFYDVMAAEARAGVLARLADRLADQVWPNAPVIDVGAGTGLSTRVLGRALRPDVQILALEPNPVMRAALMTRVWDDPNLRPRTTVMPFDALTAPLPDTIGLAVMAASIHHFDPGQRRRLLARLSERLVPGGTLLIEIQCPFATDVTETPFASTALGSMAYEGSMSAVATGDDRQAWQMTYRSRLNGEPVECLTAKYDCWTVSAAELIDDAAPLSGDTIEDWVRLRKL